MRLSAIYRYPVKSMRGEALTSAPVEQWGLAGDRRWMVVDADGEGVTAREHPTMLLLAARISGRGIHIDGPGHDQLSATPVGAEVMVSVHGTEPFRAIAAGPEADRWLSEYLQAPVRLVYAAAPTRRRLTPRFSLPGDCAAFADGYPLSLASQSSLDQVNAWIAAGPLSDEGPLPMNRFRPNLVVDGATPFAEDTWRKVRVGAAIFRIAKGVARCVLTTTDAATAARGKEPIATLAKHRRFDKQTWFAMNLIPDFVDTSIRVGDEVEVLEAAPSEGPPR